MAIRRLISDMDRERLRQTSQLIRASFVWEDTPDGHDYWSSVARKLRLMSEHGTNDGEEAWGVSLYVDDYERGDESVLPERQGNL